MNTSFLSGIFSSAAATASLLLLSSFSAAEAASFTFNTSNFTGADAKVSITLDDTAAGTGKIQFTVKMASDATTIGDIRGLFFNISDDSLLSGLKATGDHVTTTAYGAGKISSVGNANLNGDGGAHVFDFGVEIGTNGLKGGKDDIQTTTFTLSHASRALDLSMFAQQDFGIRLTSVGAIGALEKNRQDSSKLVGVMPPIQVSSPSPSPSPNPNPSPSPSPSAPSPSPSPNPNPSPAPSPNPVVITPPPSAAPVPETPSNKPTEIPEPSTMAALLLATAGGLKLLKRKDAAVQAETDSLA